MQFPLPPEIELTIQWIEEVRQICGKAIPVILVACKADLRDRAIASGSFTPDKFIDTTTVSLSCPAIPNIQLIIRDKESPTQ
jgi:hypothetical protein